MIKRSASGLKQYLLDCCVPEPNTGCWLWIRSLYSDGYGQASLCGTERRAHRLSYVVFVGAIPDGLQVLHRCDVPSCINPDHLFIGTHLENMHDMTKKNRRACGEAHPNSVNTTERIEAIRSHREKGDSQQKIADKFGIHQSTVSQILTGRTWNHQKRAMA